MKTLQSVYYCEQVLGPAMVIGSAKDGQARVQRDSVFREKDEIFRADDDEAARLIESGAARKPRLAGELAALAEATLASDSPLDAALAAMPLPRIRVWHAVREGGHWYPTAASLGPGRGGFSARFRDPDEARILWNEKANATPMFAFATPHGFDRAYIWRNRGLLEIATNVHHIRG